ncbi:putative ribonuclease H-like domain-containing protein [Tanacetum coccineum]
MTMRTKPDVDTLSIDDLYNNLRVFEHELTSASKSSASAQNVAFVSHSKNNNNKVKSGHTEQLDDVEHEERDGIKLADKNDCYSNEEVLHETRGRVRINGNKPVGFDKKKLECFKCHNTGRTLPVRGRETNHDFMAINSNNEVSLCSKTCIDSYNKLKTLCDDQINQLGEQEVKMLAYTLAVKKLEAQVVTFQKKQLSLNEQLTFQANEIYAKDEKLKKYRRIGNERSMTSNSKVGLGYEIQSNNEVLSYEEEMNRTVFKCTKEDFLNKPLYSRFSKTNNFKGVPHPLYGDYTPKPQEEIDDSLTNVNTGRSKQPVPTNNTNNFSPVRPQVVCWAMLIKTSVGYNWRGTRPNSNHNSGSNFVRTDHHQEHGGRGLYLDKWNAQAYGLVQDHWMILKNAKGDLFTLLEVAKATLMAKCRIKSTLEVTNSAETLQTPNANASEEEDAAEELIVVPTTLQHLKTQEKEAYSTGISEDTPAILAFRKELDELAQKHLREVPKNKATSTNSVNSYSGQDNTQPADQDDLDMPELTIFKPKKKITSERDFDEVYDDEGIPQHSPQVKILGDLVIYETRSRVLQQHSGDMHLQEEGIDYDEVLSPVSRIEAIRLFLAFASFMGFIVYQMDVKGAFLYGTIDEEVYVSQPPGFVDPDHPKKKNGYIRGTIDKTLFMKKDKKDIMLFKCEIIFFLGLHVKQKTDGIFISQDKYVADMLKKFDLASVKTAITLMETKTALIKDEEADEVDVTPKTSHLNAMKRIFKYIKGKPNLGLWYPRESFFDLEAYSDSDYVGANLDRKSTTESKYVAAASCCGQVLWIQNKMLDYGFNFMNTKIHIDNESTICIMKNPVYRSKIKHIEIRHHFIRDSYEKKLIRVEKIHTDFNVADLLTKAFDGPSNGGQCNKSEKFSNVSTFLSMVLEAKPVNTNLYLAYQFTKKIFGNINRGFAGVNRPLLANMIAGHDENQGEPQEEPVESQPPPNASVPSTSQPITKPYPDQELETETKLHGSSSDFVHTPPTQVETSSPELKFISPEPMEHTYDQPQPSPVQQPASPEPQPTSPPKSPPLQGPTSTYAEATRINIVDLLHLAPQLVTRIDNLEKELKEHKQTTAAVIMKLVKKVKKLETRVKYGNLPNRKMILSDSESEDAANSSKQGRNLGEEDVFETPKGKDSGEANISPSGLQAAETLVQVASQKTKTYTRRVKFGLKKKLDVGVSSGDRKSAFEEFKSASKEIKYGFTNISSGEVRVSQRKGNEVLEEQPQPKRSKKQIREEEASLAEIARI